jgi:hypothetical protein
VTPLAAYVIVEHVELIVKVPPPDAVALPNAVALLSRIGVLPVTLQLSASRKENVLPLSAAIAKFTENVPAVEAARSLVLTTTCI